MSDALTTSCELLLALAGVYLLAVGLYSVGVPRGLPGSDSGAQPGAKGAHEAASAD